MNHVRIVVNGMPCNSIVVPPDLVVELPGPVLAAALKQAVRSEDPETWRLNRPRYVLMLERKLIEGVVCWLLCEDSEARVRRRRLTGT